MTSFNRQFDLQTAHDYQYEADYKAMLKAMKTEGKRRLYELNVEQNLLEERDLYELNALEYEQDKLDNTGFEDLFSTKYLFTTTTVNINELSQYQHKY
mgnify:FL=1